MDLRRKITSTFLSGKLGATIVIPIDIARKHGLDRPSEVIVEETEDGILIRKIDMEKL
jgi:bifunctional DNA-binding transcriptional regulator/antitoxin component of YhaV-PrlF toxin-antitoxin module